jgi:hypothetical protein
MNETNTIAKLQTIITDLISRYSTLKEAIIRLQLVVEDKDSEIAQLLKEKQSKDLEIAKLIEDNEMKDLEIEDIVSKVEKILQ